MSEENKKDELKPISLEDVRKNFRIKETTVDLKEAQEDFANQLAYALQPLAKLKARQIGRVLKALMYVPVVEFDFKQFQTKDEHMLFIGLLKLQDAKIALIEAMDEPDESSADTPDPQEAS